MNPDENSPITNTVNTDNTQRGSWLEIILPFIGALFSDSIKDIKAFQNNYYILHIDKNNRTISAQHKGQK